MTESRKRSSDVLEIASETTSTYGVPVTHMTVSTWLSAGKAPVSEDRTKQVVIRYKLFIHVFQGYIYPYSMHKRERKSI